MDHPVTVDDLGVNDITIILRFFDLVGFFS